MNESSPNENGHDGDSDGSAFVSELTASQSSLLGYLVTLLPGDSEIQDILQKTNLVLWNKREQFQAGTSFRAWAFKVAYWEARAWMTSRKREAWLLFDGELVDAVTKRMTSQPIAEEEGAGNASIALRKCLAKLGGSDRLAVIYYYQHGKSLAECEQILGRSPNSLKVSLCRIRGALRRCIKATLTLQRLPSA